MFQILQSNTFIKSERAWKQSGCFQPTVSNNLNRDIADVYLIIMPGKVISILWVQILIVNQVT